MELSVQDKAAQHTAKYVSQLADVLIERYRNDIVYTKAGNVLISINPNRVIPMVTSTFQLNSSAPSSSSSSSSSSSTTVNPKSPNLRNPRTPKDGSNKSNRNSYAASTNARGMNNKSSSSNPAYTTTSASSSTGESSSVPLFHQSLMWNYYEYTKRTPAIPGLAPSPHIFGVAANALHTACYDNTNIAILCTGEPGSGKSEAQRQILRFFTTVSRAARVRQQQTINELQSRGSRLPVSLSFTAHPSVQAYISKTENSIMNNSNSNQPGTLTNVVSTPFSLKNPYPTSSKNTSPSSTVSTNAPSTYSSSAPSIEQLLMDAHTILDAFGSAGENNGNSRSPMSSRYIRWTRIKVNSDGSIVQTQVKTSLYDPWRIVCPPPGTHDYSKTGTPTGSTTTTTSVEPPSIPAATRYVLGINDPSLSNHKSKPIDGTKSTNNNNTSTKILFTVDTNYRIFYQLLAGVNEDERSNYRLLDNPIDYSYLAAYGSITCPFICEPLLERERLRRSKAFSGAAKAYAGSVMDPEDDDDEVDIHDVSSSASVYSGIRNDTAIPSTTTSSLSAANTNIPAMLNPTVLSNEFSILKAALTRFQLNANAQGAIFRIISAIILLGNLQFDVKDVPIIPSGTQTNEPTLHLTQSTTYVSNGEVLWSCASLLGVKMDALAHALTHVAINPSSVNKGNNNSNSLYPNFVTLSPAKACLVRDSLAITLYRRLWNHLVTHINAVLGDIGREAALSHNEAAKTFDSLLPPEMRPRPDINIAASIEIVDSAGLGNVYGDGLLRTTARAEAEAASLLASHSRFNPTVTNALSVTNSAILGGGTGAPLRRNTLFPGPASFANLLRNYASETVEQIYYDSVIGCPIAAYEKEGIPHAYLSALFRGNAPVNTTVISNNIKGSTVATPSTPLSANQVAWMQVFGTALPPPSTPQQASSVNSRRSSSHTVSSPVPVLDLVPFLPPPDNTSLLALFDASSSQGGIWSSLGEATRYAYHDPSYGLAAHSTSTNTKENGVTNHHDSSNDSFSSLPPSWRGNARAEGAWIDTTLSRLRRAPGTPSCVRRPNPGETDQILRHMTPYAVPSSSSIDKYLASNSTNTATDTNDSTVAPTVRQNSTASSTMMVVRHSHGEVAYMMEGIFACNSCACCESAMSNQLPNASLPTCGLPKHIQTVLGQLSSDTLVRILMTDTPLDTNNSTENTGTSDIHSFGNHSCSTTTDCLRWFLQELHSSLSVSSLQWIRCIRPTDDVFGTPSSNHIAHDTIARQIRAAGILQICLISAFGHPVSIPMTEFYERYITLDVNTLRRYGPFFPRDDTPLPSGKNTTSLSSRLNSILSPSMRVRVESMLGMIESEQDPSGALITTMEGRVAASNLADALWARLYLPQASKLKAITFALPSLHPNASLDSLMTKVFSATPSRTVNTATEGDASDMKPFRFMENTDSGFTVPSNSTTRDQIISSDGTSLASTVAVGNRHVFMSRQYAECIEAARSRAAVGMDAAARRIQAYIRSFLSRLHYKTFRSAVIRVQASFRTHRHVRAYQYFREKGFKVKAALLTHTARKRYLRILQAVAKWKSVWRRARTRRMLHEKALALRAFHTLARGFVIRSAVYKWHAAAIRVQLPIRKFLQKRKYQRATQKVAIFGQKHWRGKLSRRKHWMETARLKALRQVHIRARFIRRVVAYTQGKRIRQQYLFLRRTAIRLQRWIRALMVRRAWKRVVKAVLRIQAAIRGAADRRMVANMRSSAAAAVEACHMQALRLAEARSLGVFDSLRNTLESMIISAEEEEAELQASGDDSKYKTKRKSKSRSSSLGGYSDNLNDEYVETGKEIFGSVITGRFPQGQRDISASVAMRLRAPVGTTATGSNANNNGNFGVSLRLLDVDIRGQLRDVYYGGDMNDEEDDQAQTELTYASTAVARAEREDFLQYKAKLKVNGENESIEDKKDDDSFPLEELSAEIDRLYIRLRALDRWGNISVTSATIRVPDLSWANAFRSVAVSLASRDKQISSLAIGDTHTVTLGTDGCVYTWGWSDEGQCGHGNTIPTTSPKLVSALADPTHTAFPHASRNLTSVGINNPSIINYGTGSINPRDKNKVGTNASISASTPISRTIPTAAPITIIAIAAGREHTLALSNLGIVYAWGGNSRGQCGLGHTDSIAYPSMVPGFQKKILTIAAGDRHSAFLTQSGSVFTCGSGPCCGHGTVTSSLSPTKSSSSSTTVATSEKKKDILRKINDRRAAALQNTITPPADVLTPLPVRSLSYLTLAGLATGRGHTVVVATTGEAFAWGANEVGQCGIGKQHTLPYVAVPTQINATPASAYAASLLPEMNKKESLLAMDKTGKLIISPNRNTSNSNKEAVNTSPVSRADTTVSNENSSTNNQKPFRFVRIACGACHTLLLSAGGRILAFGRNRHGQLGTGDRIDRYEPTTVRLPLPSIHNSKVSSNNPKAYVVLDIAAAGDSSYALATTTSPSSGVTPSPTLRGTPAHLPVTLATDAVRRRMFQWGHTGSVTEARMRMLPTSSSSFGGISEDTVPPLPLVPIGVDSLDLLVPTPIRSLASHSDPTYTNSSNTGNIGGSSLGPSSSSLRGGNGDTIFDTSSVTGSQDYYNNNNIGGNGSNVTSITAPVGVFAVGHTTLSIAWVQAHTLPRLNPLVRSTGGSYKKK